MLQNRAGLRLVGDVVGQLDLRFQEALFGRQVAAKDLALQFGEARQIQRGANARRLGRVEEQPGIGAARLGDGRGLGR